MHWEITVMNPSRWCQALTGRQARVNNPLLTEREHSIMDSGVGLPGLQFYFLFFFLKIFLIWTILKVFLECVTILLLFYILVLWPRGMWYLSSLTRDQTHIPCIRRRSLEPLYHRGAGDLVVKSCPPLATPDRSLPGSSVHGILQARILEQVAIFFFRGSSQPRNWTQISCIACRFFTDWVMREALVPPGKFL